MAEKIKEKKSKKKKPIDNHDRDNNAQADNPKKSKKSLILYIIFISIVGLICAILYSVLVNYIKAIPDVIVPDVIGLDKNDAVFVLKKNKLEPFLSGTRFSEEATPNIILSTDPEPGRKVKAGRKIRYILNGGQEQIALPEITGLFPEQATDALIGNSIYVNQVDAKYSMEYREGTIMATSPNVGDLLARNTTVDVTISKGFPVELSIKKVSDGDTKALINVSLQVPLENEGDENKKTNIKIVSVSKNTPKTLFNDDISVGKELLFEFEDQLGNRIDIFYDDVLAKSAVIIF